MFEDDLTSNRVRTALILPILVLAAAGIGLILLAGSLGAATSGRSVLSFGYGAPGHVMDNSMRASAMAETVGRSGA